MQVASRRVARRGSSRTVFREGISGEARGHWAHRHPSQPAGPGRCSGRRRDGRHATGATARRATARPGPTRPDTLCALAPPGFGRFRPG
ncbi:hypothetical protein TK50_21045 [Micromonospora haikouensis]|uniref:Uncharacterized protein n=1 Tax=Micromonospora haikouensis TaxID=686309 RepID=A0A0D0VR99_9ACTN|nr:hypothetical protein TK50_21045 [Micromonospora haikouensis]